MAATGGPGAVTGVFPRGGESNFTLVFVDDVPVNAFGGDYDFGHLHDRERRADRDRARTAERAVWIERDRRGGARRHAPRRAADHFAARVEAGGYGHVPAGRRNLRLARRFRVGRVSRPVHAATVSTDTSTSSGLTVTNDDYERGDRCADRRLARGGKSVRAQVRHAIDERGSPGPFGDEPDRRFTRQIDDHFTSRQLADAGVGTGALPLGRARVRCWYPGRIQSARQRVRESVRSVRVQLAALARSRRRSTFPSLTGARRHRRRRAAARATPAARFITDVRRPSRCR